MARYPAIPEPTTKPESLRDSILSLKQAFEILTGQRGNPDYAAAMPSDLADLTTYVDTADTDLATAVALKADKTYVDAADATHTTNIGTNTTNISTLTTKISGYESAWTAYTPTLTAQTGAFTSASATGKYKQNGKTVFVNIAVTITTVGTASGAYYVTPPVAANGTFILTGRDTTVTGASLHGTLNGSSMEVLTYANLSAINASSVMYITGVYEST